MDELFKIISEGYAVTSTHDNALFRGVSTHYWYYDSFPSFGIGNAFINTSYTIAQPLVVLSNTGTKMTVNGEEVVMKSEMDALKAELAALKEKLGYE